MKNNKGFAVTGILYTTMLLFILFLVGILGVLSSNKIALDKMKNEVMTEIDG